MGQGGPVPIERQSRKPSSTLNRFLDKHLPHRADITATWLTELRAAPWTPLSVSHGADDIGCALEMRIGLDVATRPAPWPLLSYLPIEECAALLGAVGFEHTRVGRLPPSGTSDPMLMHWSRNHEHQPGSQDMRQALATCLGLVELQKFAHKRGDTIAVDVRRSWFIAIVEQGRLSSNTEMLGALLHAWTGYLEHGQRVLRALGERAIIAPELAGGFGIADLVVGSTLIEIKMSAGVEKNIDQWLRQLLGYLLLDRHNALGIDTVAVYAAGQGLLLTRPVAEVLKSASVAPTPQLTTLREEFAVELRRELDAFEARRQRKRYSLS